MKKIIILFFGGLIMSTGCYDEEKLNVPVKDNEEVIRNEIDEFIEEKFTKEFGMAIRYRFVDRYVLPTQRVTPPRLEAVIPMLEFIEEFWIDPYLAVDNGEEFFKGHVPAEIVFLGGPIFNENGTITLGTADAGAQITFTNVNEVDISDKDWVIDQLRVVYHEFAHTIHQRYKLPTAFEEISPTGYTSPNAWFILNDEDALLRGFVTPYATSSPNEDFAETVAKYLFEEDFVEDFLLEENCDSPGCEERNIGRLMINEKLNAVRSHYKKVTGLDLDEIRARVQEKLNL